MIKRHKSPIVPLVKLSRVLSQIQFMIVNGFQRSKRDCPERYNHSRIDKRDCAPKKIGTVTHFARRRPPVCAGCRPRTAQRSAGDENLRALQIYRSEKPFEVLSRLIAGEGNARAVSAFATRRFADEHHARLQRTV